MKKYAIGLYEKAMPDALTWEEKLLVAKEAGYDFVEISIDESDTKQARLLWSAEERAALVDTMQKVGVPLRSMCLSGHRKYPFGATKAEDRARSLEIMEKAIELADDLGIRIIQLAGYDVYYEESSAETKEWFLDNLKKAAELAACKGILMGFETMETPFMNTVWKSMFYVNAVNSPYLGVYPDIGNLTNAAVAGGASVLDDLESGKGHLIAMHLKPTLPGQFRDLYFDDERQHVDFQAAIGKAWELGVRRYVTELWCLGKPEWKQNIRIAHDTMAAILDEK